MAQYINKDDVVAEIEKRERRLDIDSPYGIGAMVELECLKDFLDTIEVKEVSLEKEFKDFLDNVEGIPRMWHPDEQIEWGEVIAKHFFELGLKVAQKGK